MFWCIVSIIFYSITLQIGCTGISLQNFLSETFPLCTIHFHRNCSNHNKIDQLLVSRESKVTSSLLPHLNLACIQSCANQTSNKRVQTHSQIFYGHVSVFNSRYAQICLGHVSFPNFVENQLNQFPDPRIWSNMKHEQSRLYKTIIPTYFFGIIEKTMRFNTAAYISQTIAAIPVILVSLLPEPGLRITAIHMGIYTFSAALKAFRTSQEISDWNDEYVSLEFIQINHNVVQIQTKKYYDNHFLKKNPPHTLIYSFSLPAPHSLYLTTLNCMPNRRNNYLASFKIHPGLDTISEHGCAIGKYAELTNCTFQSCFHSLNNRIRYIYTIETDKSTDTNYRLLSQGVYVDQIYFFVLLGIHENRKSISPTNLLAPFPLNVWIALVTLHCITYVVFLLSTRSFEKTCQLAFWLFSVLVEQDVSVKAMTQHLSLVSMAMLWTAGAFILRFMYTGDVYGGLAQGYVPQNVPTTFEHIFNQTDNIYKINRPLEILATRIAGSYTLFALWSMAVHNNKTHRHGAAIRKTMRYSDFEVETITNISEGKQIDCYDKPFASNPTQCQTDGRIALVYSSVPDSEENGINSFQGVLKTSEKRKLFENPNQAPFLTNFRLWEVFQIHGTLVRNFEKFVGRIHENGMFDYFVKTIKGLKEKSITKSIGDDENCQIGAVNDTLKKCGQKYVISSNITRKVNPNELTAVFIVCSTLLFVSFVVFLIEKH